MQGGLFGLNNKQKAILYGSQVIPTAIVLFRDDILEIVVLLLLFYLIITLIYIRFGSLQKSIEPYLFNELTKVDNQVQKGISLGFSGFLLISIYGVIVLHIGRVALPQKVYLGMTTHTHYFLFLLCLLINPLLEEWYWRLFLPKTFQETYYQSHVINTAYLLFHFALFSKYVGFWRAVPLVGTFFSVGRSMSHIKQKYGIISAIIAHYGITFAGFVLAIYIAIFTETKF